MLDDNWHSILNLLLLIFPIIWLINSQLKILRTLKHQESIENKIAVSTPQIAPHGIDKGKAILQIYFIVNNYSSQIINVSIVNEECSLVVGNSSSDSKPQKNFLKKLKPYQETKIFYNSLNVVDISKEEIDVKAKLVLQYWIDENICYKVSDIYHFYTLKVNQEYNRVFFTCVPRKN